MTKHVKRVAALTGVLACAATPAVALPTSPTPTLPRPPGDAPAGWPAQGSAAERSAPTPAPDQWIVELDAAPLSRYGGGVPGLRATAPRATGRGLDASDEAVRAYRRHLDDRQAAVLRTAPGVRPDVEYRAALAGFAARLSDAQVAALRGAPGVRRVTREAFVRLEQAQPAATASEGIAGSEPELLGLPGGLWKRLGGPAQAGRGIIVGIVDSGITPEAPSFADRGLEPPASWDGACQGGEQFPVTSCSDKLIGARYFVDGFGRDYIRDGAFLSPRDEAGHGTHVAAIAVGNRVDPGIDGDDLGVERISGVAPAAHLAVYKACWLDGACSDVDVVAAIDTAVADGVDVINMSLGRFPWPARVDPIQLAALNADAAGVAVVASAGNFGDPGGPAGAISAPGVAPWTTAVGATTGARTFRGTLHATGPDGAAVEAPASLYGPGLPSAELVDAGVVGPPHTGDPIVEPRNCLDPLDPADVRGKVVLCDGPGPFLLVDPLGDIAKTVAEAGGVGLVLSWPYGDPPLLNWPVPVAAITPADAAALRAMLQQGATQVSSTPGHAVARAADRIAPFSSRGPVTFYDERFQLVPTELLRPDVVAPGVDTLSAYAPRTLLGHLGLEGSKRFAVLSGTSMASPAVAGVTALLRQLHPHWSPAALRSALVTSARPQVTDVTGQHPAGADAVGGGRVDPSAAADADLVVEPTTDEYRRYAEGLDPAAVEGDLEPLAARDLNVPALALPSSTDTVEVARTFTNAGPARATWTIEQYISPERDAFVFADRERFTLRPGQRQTVHFRITVLTASSALRRFTIRLRNVTTGRETRLPVAARNVGVVDLPPSISVSAGSADGSQDIPVTVSAPVSAVALGLARPKVQPGLSTEMSFLGNNVFVPLKVGRDADALVARATPTEPGATVGIGLYRDGDHNGRLSQEDEALASVSSGEELEDALLDVPAGDYLVGVFAAGETPVPFDLRTWVVRDARPDDPRPAPGLVADGDPFDPGPAPTAERTMTLRWSGVDGAEPLRGVVLWQAGADRLGTSIVKVSPGGTAR